MTIFYTGGAILVILALLFVLWPFIEQKLSANKEGGDQGGESPADVRESTNISLYHDHLADIDQSLAAGAINQTQYDQLKLELERNLLEDSQASSLDDSAQEQKGANNKTRVLMASLVVGVLVASGFLYQQLGAYESWQIKTSLEQRRDLENDYSATGSPDVLAQIRGANRGLIEQLKSYVEKKPDNVQMRALLAGTAMSVGDYGLAISHFQGVLQREPELAQIMAELAQADFLQAGNKVVPIVESLVQQSLSREPNNTIALGLAGIGAFQAQEYRKAIQVWRKAIALQGAGSPNSVALQRGIDAALEHLGAEGAELASEPEPVVPEVVAANDVVDPSITVSVVLSGDVEADPDTTVFIYARAWQGAKVPLSIARLQFSQLPTTLTLTNAMAMAPTMNLNSTKAVELVARVSKSGTPVPQAGDWQGSLGPIEVRENNTQPYTLMIADKVL